MMKTISIVGLLWGDEGKGKIVDLLSERADIVVRYQGGTNAGHTVYYQGEAIALHLVPSGIFNKNTICVIGNGCVVDLGCLIDEIACLEKRGIDVRERLRISKRAHITFPFHIFEDKRSEEIRGGGKIGTTARGIGPSYTDKSSRLGIRIGDLLHPELFKVKLKAHFDAKQAVREHFEEERILEEYAQIAETLKCCFIDAVSFLNKRIDKGDRVLFEGAQGTLLDIDLGTYPFVTSSNPTVGGVSTGTGVPPSKIGKVIGVAKAYATRVGAGPFPTEFEERFQDEFRTSAKEFGATTGRPRKCGWFDTVAIGYACMVNGVSSIILTKLDCLSGFKVLKICVGYASKKGTPLASFPSHIDEVALATPVYEEISGWQEEIQGVTDEQQLPPAARQYISRLEELLNVNVALISTGPDRNDIIVREELWS
jgi:adenylosuccinate synthase